MRRTFGLTVVAAVMILWVFITGRDFIVTGLVDLGIHELGHMLAIPFGQTVHFLAGSATQVLAPAGLAGYFYVKGDTAASGLMGVWSATSIKDVAIYMADAKTRSLPLIGGTHDWWWLFSRHGNLDAAKGWGGFVGFLGLMVGVACVGWLGHQSWQLWKHQQATVFVRID